MNSRSKMAGNLLAFAAGALLLGACGGAGGPGAGGSGGAGTPPSLTVQNDSQFALLALKVHRGMDHTAAVNLLDTLHGGEPLEPEQHVEIISFDSGANVTIVREQVQNGPKIAITTGVPIELGGSPRKLLVFDESFRLVLP